MADPQDIHPRNAAGEFFNDLSCIDCGMCPELAPSVFRRDHEEGFSFVFRQPSNQEERDAALDALKSCPTESIGRLEAAVNP